MPGKGNDGDTNGGEEAEEWEIDFDLYFRL